MINEKTINNIKQVKIKYLVKDFAEYGVPEDITREILLKRGINKWLHNRMLLINLKDELKQDINYHLATIRNAKKLAKLFDVPIKEIYKRYEVVGILKATNCIREQIRKICHNSRWVFPE